MVVVLKNKDITLENLKKYLDVEVELRKDKHSEFAKGILVLHENSCFFLSNDIKYDGANSYVIRSSKYESRYKYAWYVLGYAEVINILNKNSWWW